MPEELEIEVGGESLVFNAFKTLTWKRKNLLILTDPHFGKVNHFRKNGIPVPMELLEENFHRLEQCIDHCKPEEVLILGDLFHSTQNDEWTVVKDFVASYSTIRFSLVMGNHDILSPGEWADSGIEVYSERVEEPFQFTHFPLDEPNLFNICGHVHPGVSLRGGPGGGTRLPCFYITENQMIMPAFGTFTGNYRVRPKRNDRVIAIGENRLFLFEHPSRLSKQKS